MRESQASLHEKEDRIIVMLPVLTSGKPDDDGNDPIGLPEAYRLPDKTRTIRWLTRCRQRYERCGSLSAISPNLLSNEIK